MLHLFALAPLVSGCFLPRYTAKWPLRGPMIQVVNPTDQFVQVSARDGFGRALVIGTVAPRSHACRPWPFVDERGWLLTETERQSGQAESEMFYPWAFNGWRWTVGERESFVAAEVCGT
jgi:hypothetical protein